MSILLCRQCHEPIHESAHVCPHCGEEQPETPGPPPEPNLELVPVFRTVDAGLVALAKSLLEGEGIQFFVVPHPDHATFGELLGKLGVVADVFVVDHAAGR